MTQQNYAACAPPGSQIHTVLTDEQLDFLEANGRTNSFFREILLKVPGAEWCANGPALGGGGAFYIPPQTSGGGASTPPPNTTPAPPPGAPAAPGATPGLPASPLPQSIARTGGTALGPIYQGILRALRAAKAGRSGPFGIPIPGSAGGLLKLVLGIIGVSFISDLISPDQDPNGRRAEMLEKFLEVIEDMELAGVIYPYTASRRFAMQGMTDPGPKYLIFDLEQGQGNYSNFHMSRAGLRAHDDKQDTYKRPARAPRRSASPARRR